MLNSDDPSIYLERAEMHEQLAAGTDDLPARKMHLAMAAEYRRKAAEIGAISIERNHMDNMVRLHATAS
ncbi:hypothetical protein [Rhizorhapis suberifaciens]|uniref:Uncharacterized protein n=1 Tax=Rhizorhapis suberifaciens TaxID=13656 RepID=A0A840HUI1_9SPHN|nr:hypothetical protein [Rhizorhapis suberifaciens]MBB4641912.1 hypothetical protein [Rhizorhapis suberifaciens]